MVGAFLIGVAAFPTVAQTDSVPPVKKPWQLHLSLSATHGLIGVGREFGNHFLQTSIQGLGYSSRDGLVVALGASYDYRLWSGKTPYLGVAIDLPWSEASDWNTSLIMPALGYEYHFEKWILHLEAFAGTPLDGDFTEAWGYGFGVGAGFPF